VSEARLQSVAGHADRAPLLPAEPHAAANRRVAITLLRQAPAPAAPSAAPEALPTAAPAAATPIGFVPPPRPRRAPPAPAPAAAAFVPPEFAPR
jgi:hypothetical protein